MVIVGGWIEVAPEHRDAYLEARHEGIVKTRTEPGCVEYVFSPDPEVPGRVRLFEVWDSAEDLDVHLQLLRSGPPAAPEYPVLAREVFRYGVSSKEPNTL